MRRGASIACQHLKIARDLLLRQREVAHYCSEGAAASSSIFINADIRPKIGMRFFSSSMTTFKDLRTVKDDSFTLWEQYGKQCMLCHSVRTIASDSSQSSGPKSQEGTRKDISTVDDPFDAPTYHIPEKPVTFTEGASYSVIILAGLGVAGFAAYAVFKELIFEPKEYKIFGKALERIQHDSQVSVRIGSPVTGYGSESRNRAARQRIPNRVWTDEDGIEHVEVNFYIRGPHGAGKVYTEMFKDSSDNKWKFTYLIVEIKSPSPVKLLLESYVPA
ncbi:probable mitochondrial import inner membrane translocase subunit TIM21 isoform X2 [Asparagus officinalis]|uniref:probable mitochondrial import inner membrane translocase subunit TIM21 isoform X2 n=1 Tax=Asparagus officinalis TaxID=4686 RepID=UPI00098E3F6F|nr:probable mitochondrial import inner membrane translocase subunit TIM21 isoform X2 [Asparagus officinalis]